MLIGYWMLTKAIAQKSAYFGELMGLYITLNVYEFLLIGLGLFLIVKKGVAHDGKMLLLIGILFLTDITFMNNEIITAHPGKGALIHVLTLVLTGLKIGLVFYWLRMKVKKPLLIYTIVEYCILIGGPGILAVMAGARILASPMIYYLWVVAGGLLAFKGLVIPSRMTKGKPEYPAARTVLRALAVIPYISLLIHLGASGWIYEFSWHPVYLGPLFLGLAAFIGFAKPAFITERERGRLQLLLPVIALIFSIRFPADLAFNMTRALPWMLSPFRIILIGSAVVYVSGFWEWMHQAFIWCGSISLVWAAMGHTMKTTWERLVAMAPKTVIQWGITAVVMAFLFLGIGAFFSLHKTKPGEGLEGVK